MEYWIIDNGVPLGPFTPDQLASRRISPHTKVWRAGLTDWVEAGALEELESVLSPQGDTDAVIADPSDVPPPMAQQAVPSTAYATCGPAATLMPKQPPTYLGWNVAMLLCCCLVGGIIGLVFSLLSASRYRQGRYDLARRWSQRAELMVIVSFTLGCVSWPFMAVYQILTAA